MDSLRKWLNKPKVSPRRSWNQLFMDNFKVIDKSGTIEIGGLFHCFAVLGSLLFVRHQLRSVFVLASAYQTMTTTKCDKCFSDSLSISIARFSNPCSILIRQAIKMWGKNRGQIVKISRARESDWRGNWNWNSIRSLRSAIINFPIPWWNNSRAHT